ncbi:ATP-binding protein [Chitinilyticum piscinae]|uniref:histidine kinase n=1 Tax=Chitinilyticum piscinae TaxID=2866724 RepID=A0A8J7FEZ3_9NEIS|nr:ATP-binding protein [Chitinilyticum piscinae]MBE9608178.1 HAMP domain-containing protein [Chitinilyticum piscinae]
MWSIFLRQFIPLVATILLTLLGVGHLSGKLLDDYFQDFAQYSYQGPFDVLQASLLPAGAATSDAELLANAQTMHQRMGRFGVNLRPLDSFEPAPRARLAKGHVWVDMNNEFFFRRIADRNYVLSIEPPNPPNILALNILVYVIAVLLLAIVYFFLFVRPFWRDLQTLRQAAQRMGEGDLDTRITLHQRSVLQALAQRMNEMAGRIAQLMRNQNELLNAVAHELRTPLARTRFAITMQEEAAAERQPLLRQSALDDLDEMETLIRELLGYGRLDARSGPPQCSAIPAAVWLTELSSSPDDRLPVTLALADAPATLFADAALLEHALVNILRNAQRYACSQIVLSCRRLANGHCEIVIEDDGPGIAEADRERVFEPFVRLDDSRSRDTGGIGLGLAIVRRIIQRHGGSVAVAAALAFPSGARFVVQLPPSP